MRHKNPRKRQFIILILSIAVLIVALVGTIVWQHHKNSFQPTIPGVNLSPPTKAEKQESDQTKQRIVQQQVQPPTPAPAPTSQKKSVSVTITNASSDTVTAYITGAFEDGGTCTATFTQGSSVVTRTSSGFKNVSYTQCTPITPNLPTGGNWSVKVSYDSDTASGTSAASTF